MPELLSPAELGTLEEAIDHWFKRQTGDGESGAASAAGEGSDIGIFSKVIVAVERGPSADSVGPRQWYVRVRGEEKDSYTIRFELRQRTLAYETYLMPAPEENQAEFYQHLLRRNLGLYGASFAVGSEDGIFLQGQVDCALLAMGTDAAGVSMELDRIVGSIYQWVELFFKPALRIGFASKF